MITKTTTPSTLTRSPYCSVHVDGPATPWNGTALSVTGIAAAPTGTPAADRMRFEQFGDRTPTTGPPRGATG